MTLGGQSTSNLLITRAARKTRLHALAERLGHPDKAHFYYIVVILVLDLLVLSMIQYMRRGYHPILAFPLWFVPPVGTVIGVWVVRHLARQYDTMMNTLIERADNPKPLRGGVASIRFQQFLYVLIVAGGILFYSFQSDIRLALAGEVLFIGKFVVVFLGLYYLFIAEAVAVIIGIHILLPWRIVQSEFQLDFGNRDRLGGLKSVGQLIQRSTQAYFIGLFLFTLVVFASLIFPSQPVPAPGNVFSAIFIGAWIMGFVLFMLPTALLHREMKHQKEEQLQLLHDELVKHGEHNTTIPNRPAEDEEIPQYLYFHLALDQVERTHEYPTNAELMRDIGVSALPSILLFLVTSPVPLLTS